MDKERILKYNKLCAEFLGAKNLGKLGYSDLESYSHDLFIRTEWSNKYQDNIETDIMVLSSMLFDSDWNWIMEVVEAIEKLDFETQILDNGMCIEGNLIIERWGNTKKEGVIETINQFLIWYKENK